MFTIEKCFYFSEINDFLFVKIYILWIKDYPDNAKNLKGLFIKKTKNNIFYKNTSLFVILIMII